MAEDQRQKELEAQVARLRQEKELAQSLPHLYGFPFYKWSRKFYESCNKNNFLCAANQISKSSTLIRKNINWATTPTIWGKLWPLRRPFQFWYLYPTKDIVLEEFELKWVPEFLPRGKVKKEHPVFGWDIVKERSDFKGIRFNSGVTLFFKTYSQNKQHLQAGTVDMISFDEELPEDLYDELNFRRQAVDGYLNGVFTATLGQEFWREAFEEKGEHERFKDALKLQVALTDCMEYEDGSPSPWTKDRIQRVINSCKSKAEVDRRVFGKFVRDTGLRFQGFQRHSNVKKPLWKKPPQDWIVYSGVDTGSGGENHPAAFAFVAVSADYKYGRVFRGWRGGYGAKITASDILHKYLDVRGDVRVTIQQYDWSAKDFHTISTRMGIPFLPAEKSHEIGETMLNVLFKNNMLDIDDIDELHGLVSELSSLRVGEAKTRAKDDFADALRYAIARIPWNWEAIKFENLEQAEEINEDRKTNQATTDTIDDLRQQTYQQEKRDRLNRTNEHADEFEEWNDLYGS